MPTVVLISQMPLPYSGIGSWTTLYNNYLRNNHKIDSIVCSKPEELFEGILYSFVKVTFVSKLKNRLLKRKKTEYLKALDKLINPQKKYIIQVVDNYGMIKPLQNYLLSKGIRNNCYIQFFYHGYPPYVQKTATLDFYENIDEIILLTKDSYILHKKEIKLMPDFFSILPNGINTDSFKKIADLEKNKLKEQFNVEDKTVFLWCSNDRPKKGLELILEVWKNLYVQFENIVLLVVGAEREKEIKGVRFLGKIPNESLPEYYQLSDCYLFPTLCQEGFGLSLIEALHCGCHCIASALGGVPEVLQYGKLGRLIENPHLVVEWEEAIIDFLKGKFEISNVPENLYSQEQWNVEMNTIIENAKFRLKNNSAK
ncbi:glycosyl transferase family 1 [Flavobacterium sp. L1I52]|uniref:Glycosyl transferase family 1 n=1 Tax=Flavobacterium pokkalii TaxID=1940408 RepID=A0ABR7UUH9_9FLAO|nr:glycosyltransferase family 4 protein [Flavobacterium pokkalii]MBD0726571.1 glycosyl transferase family 1 [Flavobacterium pokkalii]